MGRQKSSAVLPATNGGREHEEEGEKDTGSGHGKTCRPERKDEMHMKAGTAIKTKTAREEQGNQGKTQVRKQGERRPQEAKMLGKGRCEKILKRIHARIRR